MHHLRVSFGIADLFSGVEQGLYALWQCLEAVLPQ